MTMSSRYRFRKADSMISGLLYLIPILLLPSVLATCYFGNGNIDQTAGPCGNDPDGNVCCPNNYYCTNEGVCVSPDYKTFFRESCTVDGNAFNCPNFCFGINDGPAQLNYCGNDTFCCPASATTGCDCNDQSQLHNFGAAILMDQIVADFTGGFTFTTLAVEATLHDLLSSTSPPTSLTVPPATGLSTSAKAGIGVGVVLGLLLIALTFWVFSIKRRQRLAARPQTNHWEEKPELPAINERNQVVAQYPPEYSKQQYEIATEQHYELAGSGPNYSQLDSIALHEVSAERSYIPRKPIGGTQ